jgi:Fe-S oxidoreductase
MLLRTIASNDVIPFPDCCSEAGTLALSRPDIAAAMLDRKRAGLSSAEYQPVQSRRLITNCPACVNGLGRLGLAPPLHMAVALAWSHAPQDWKAKAIERLARAETIRF